MNIHMCMCVCVFRGLKCARPYKCQHALHKPDEIRSTKWEKQKHSWHGTNWGNVIRWCIFHCACGKEFVQPSTIAFQIFSQSLAGKWKTWRGGIAAMSVVATVPQLQLQLQPQAQALSATAHEKAELWAETQTQTQTETETKTETRPQHRPSTCCMFCDSCLWRRLADWFAIGDAVDSSECSLWDKSRAGRGTAIKKLTLHQLTMFFRLWQADQIKIDFDFSSFGLTPHCPTPTQVRICIGLTNTHVVSSITVLLSYHILMDEIYH